MASKLNANVEGIPTSLPYQDGLSYGLTAFSDGNIELLLAIFLSIFITADFSHGTMKNVVSKGFPRFKTYLSKLVTMIIAAFLMIVTSFITGSIVGSIVIGSFGHFTGAFVGQLVSVIGVELLLHMALISVFVMVAMIVRSNGGVIAINILGMSFVPMIYTLLEYLFHNKITFSKYGLMNNIQFYLLNTTATGEDFLRSVIVGLLFLTVTAALGILAFRKMDVK